jgi:BirA family biotin operon repressor/biotin-[acetyl-CoA-carboxylase] ligase
MTQPCEEWQLDTRRLGRRVLVFDRVSSTNTLAASLAGDPANDGVAVLADEQTAGRGQYGRAWVAAPGAGVLLSLLLFPPPPLRRPAVLAAWAAVSVCATVRQVAGTSTACIKWPNDVLLHGRKVCGILIEQAQTARAGGGEAATVVGIGLNVRQTAADLAEAGLPQATSLAAHTATPPDTRAVAARLIRQLDEEYDRLCRGDLATLEASWKGHLGLLGRPVLAEGHDGSSRRGRLLELGFDGIVLEESGSAPLVLPPEKVRHLHPGGPPNDG